MELETQFVSEARKDLKKFHDLTEKQESKLAEQKKKKLDQLAEVKSVNEEFIRKNNLLRYKINDFNKEKKNLSGKFNGNCNQRRVHGYKIYKILTFVWSTNI